MERILVPTAGAAPAQQMSVYAAKIAKRLGVEIVALHIDATDKTRPDSALDVFVNAAEEARVEAVTAVRTGDVVEQILKAANEFDVAMILMGASRSRDFDKWISMQVMKQSNIPVLVAPFQVD